MGFAGRRQLAVGNLGQNVVQRFRLKLAASRIGRGSAVAVILLTISLGVIIPYLYQVFSKENRT